MLTIKQAKEARCESLGCRTWHFTCRRCGFHGSIINQWVEWRHLLCKRCGEAYELWFRRRYLKPALDRWNAMSDEEKDLARVTEGSPFWPRARVAEFIKKCPVMDSEGKEITG